MSADATSSPQPSADTAAKAKDAAGEAAGKAAVQASGQPDRRSRRGGRRRRRGPKTAAPSTPPASAEIGPPPLVQPADEVARLAAEAERRMAERLGSRVAASPVPPILAAPSPPADGERVRPPVYAALDLGTNNCRLLVAVPTRPGQFRVIDAFSRIVRLGEGLSRTGRLAAPAMDRAVAALAICSQKLAARQVAGARLIATEACRAADNGYEFIERVRAETGLKLEIVSRETEARLAVSGCGSLVDRSADGAVLFDIGGGSSEIALLDLRSGYSRRLSNAIVGWTSLPVGVVTLAERYGGRNVTPAVFRDMIDEVSGLIAGFAGRGRLDEVVGGERFHLLGTSGTVTTLAGVHLGLERYDRRQVDGLWLTSAEVDELVGRIAGWSFEERVANPCIGSDRADLVLAGCAILEAIRIAWPARSLRVADRGLREGLLTEMMVADGVWRSGSQARNSA
ncbi:Ppx/GppA family phosphatase [Mangrovicella endophytica]|uniref:Ppx/GppA phosphatase family protein n=1 Tax=Mangrovicella endophytica TaxID=2066697 RepID=UPI003CC926BA